MYINKQETTHAVLNEHEPMDIVTVISVANQISHDFI
jgi:hypothetical protein